MAYTVQTAACVAAAMLLVYTGVSETRLAEDAYAKQQREPAPPAPLKASPRPEPTACFHMSREHCPPSNETVRCRILDLRSALCCDVNSIFQLTEGFANNSGRIDLNRTSLHILNASIDELNVEHRFFNRLTNLSITDGRIGKIVGQFPMHSPLQCLNISNNSLTSDKLWTNKSIRPFKYVTNNLLLDLSANNLTELPPGLGTRKVTLDLSGNNYTLCKEFLKVMESNNLTNFLNYNKTFCALSFNFNWFNESQFVPIEHISMQKELNESCRLIKPSPDCLCTLARRDFSWFSDSIVSSVSVDCTGLNLKEMPTNLPRNTIRLNVSNNHISSLAVIGDDPSYERVRELYLDHNDVQSLIELEGTRFIDTFMVFSLVANKLKTIHTYVLSNTFDYTTTRLLLISANEIHCDCNTEKVLKVWLLENSKNIPDYDKLMCAGGGAVIELVESRVCQQQRHWTDYIYYMIAIEVIVLVLLIAKVSYDYWVFKTAGYLPWPANKMPRLPCDWLCE